MKITVIRFIITLAMTISIAITAYAYQNISPYAWCGGNPVAYVDPTGMFQLSSKLQQQYPKFSAYIQNFSQVWGSKDSNFKQDYREFSKMTDHLANRTFKNGMGPKIKIEPLPSATGNTGGEKIQNKGKTKLNIVITIDKELVENYEKAATEEEIGCAELMLESIIFHECVHTGILMKSDGNESGEKTKKTQTRSGKSV